MSSQLLVPYSYDVLRAGVTHLATLGIAIWAAINHKYIYAFFRTLPRDVKALSRLIKVFRDLRYVQKNNVTVGQMFDENVQRDPQKVILYFEEQKWTNEQVANLVNKIANYFQAQGFKKNDSVALFMENRPEYLCIWLGLSKIGVVAALTNYNLRLQSLRHCFEAVNCKAIIYNEELSPALKEVMEIGGLGGTGLYCLCSDDETPSITSAVHLKKALTAVPDTPPVVPDKIEFQDKLFYIYTSGTTGLPKAAIIKHSRYLMASVHVSDTLYTALPLYHGAGNMLGGGVALCYGVPMVIRKKFSASNFWKDCIRYNVTAAQYIGEICRYLLAQPPSPLDKSHKVRLMFGNGLRKELFCKFHGILVTCSNSATKDWVIRITPTMTNGKMKAWDPKDFPDLFRRKTYFTFINLKEGERVPSKDELLQELDYQNGASFRVDLWFVEELKVNREQRGDNWVTTGCWVYLSIPNISVDALQSVEFRLYLGTRRLPALRKSTLPYKGKKAPAATTVVKE